jgi:hypothetical protein
MFLDPHYTGFQKKENRLPAVGVEVLSTTLPDTLYSTAATALPPTLPVVLPGCRSCGFGADSAGSKTMPYRSTGTNGCCAWKERS